MKKIAIVTRRMVMGGIEKALISMVELMAPDKYDVTIFLMGDGGELIKDIPQHVKIKYLFGSEKSIVEKVLNKIKKGSLIESLNILKYAWRARQSKTMFEQELNYSKMGPREETEYDLAVAYHVPASFPVVYVMNNLKAKTKVAWIHSDVSVYKKDLEVYSPFYSKYNHIFCVSKSARDRFVGMYPELEDKTSVFYNIIDSKKLEIMAIKSVGYSDNFSGTRILTVGRLTPQKGQDIVPEILRKLQSDGLNVRWYFIGDGESRKELETLISKYKLENDLILLGNQENPFPYLKQSDLYVQPSRHEGYCITLAEARVFHKPIVTTDFVGAREQIRNGYDGLIVNFDQDEIYSGIKKVITEKALRDEITNNLAKGKVDTISEITKLNLVV
jgi:glycosyltransferase involved in cell wall biosynthesis